MFSGTDAGSGGDGAGEKKTTLLTPGATTGNGRPLSTELMSAQLQPRRGELTALPQTTSPLLARVRPHT